MFSATVQEGDIIKSLARALLRSVLLRAPIMSGLTAITFHPFVQWLLSDLPDVVPGRLRDGTPIMVAPHDHDGGILYLFGTNDPKVAATTAALLRHSDIFLDIGANYATIGLGVGRQAAAVHLFEPQQKLGDRVAGAIKVGGFTRVTLHRIGLMDVDGSFTLRSPQDHSGTASFAAPADENYYDTSEICAVRAIGPYVGALVGEQAFAAKVDIEGAEPHILPWLLEQPNLRFLLFEASNNREALYDLVIASGRQLYGLVRHPLRMRYSRIDSLAELAEFHDVVAINPAGPGPKQANRRALKALLSA